MVNSVVLAYSFAIDEHEQKLLRWKNGLICVFYGKLIEEFTL